MHNRFLPKYVVAGQVRNEYIIDVYGKARHNQIGGSAIYAAASLSHWDQPVGLLGVIGKDYPPEQLALLDAKQLDTRGIKTLPENLDLRAFYSYPAPDICMRENPVAAYAANSLSFPKELIGYTDDLDETLSSKNTLISRLLLEEIPQDYLDAPAAHICPLDHTCQLQLTTLFQLGSVRTITLQPHPASMVPENWGTITVLAKDIHTIITREQDLRALFRQRANDIWEMMEDLCRYGCSHVVVKISSSGYYYYDSQLKSRYQIPDYPGKCTDPTGELDAFCGAYLAGYMTTYDGLHAAVLGSVAVSINRETSGPFSIEHSLPGLDQARFAMLEQMVTRY